MIDFFLLRIKNCVKQALALPNKIYVYVKKRKVIFEVLKRYSYARH